MADINENSDSSEASDAEEITLEVEGTPVQCKKKDLIEHSDYFKAMLEGNFMEKNQSSIKLEGVELKSLSILLTLLWDEDFIIENEDILMVLQTACMLQFNRIKYILEEKVTAMLSPKNCLKIWLMAERLSLKPLYLKAKLLTLNEFLTIKDTDCILELSLEEIVSYLGNVYIKTDTEFSIFQTFMRWWYDNCKQFSENSTDVLLKLLSCINYHNLDESYFNEILLYPDIANNSEVIEILNCLHCLKKDVTCEPYSAEVQTVAQSLLKCKNRLLPQCLCLLVSPFGRRTRKGSEEDDNEELDLKNTVYIDKYKRKRPLENLCTPRTGDLCVLYFDDVLRKFKYLFEVDNQKCSNLEGFKILGYKELVFMFGGQYVIGRGDWNHGFWVYDSIREKWGRKSTLPYQRRHFETCSVDTKVFITGGTGMYRITQDNMFSYDYKEDVWSKEQILPSYDRQFKCCCVKDMLFLFTITGKYGYFFLNEELYHWKKVKIEVDDHLAKSMAEYGVFWYKDNLFVKGKKLIQFELKEDILVAISEKTITDIDYDKIELVVCNNLAYTYYINTYSYTLEEYNIDTGELRFLIDHQHQNHISETVDGAMYNLGKSKIFTFHHHNLVEGNKLVNDSFT